MKFTDTFIKNLKAEKEWVEKIEATGLGVRVTPTGNKSWFYRFTLNGKRCKMSLGKYPAISIKQARELFLKAQSMKENGINPIEHSKQEKQKYKKTVKSLILSWYTNYIEKHRKQPKQAKQQIDADIIPLLGDMELEKIQPRDITNALDKIVNRGSPIHANKVLSTLKQAFNYAVSRGEMTINPAATIRSRDIGGIEKPRERFLTLDEIKALWLFLDSDNSRMSLQIRTALKIILLTGVRSSELRLAKWNEIDFEQSLWTIPSNHTKNALVMKIHLTPLTQSLFELLKAESDSSFVIPGLNDEEPLTDKAIARAVSRIQTRVGIPHWTAHDLRRTFATQLGQTLNVDPVVIEKCLGHKMPKIMATYNKNEMLPQRQAALNQWSEFIENSLLETVSTQLIHINEDAISSL
ncbi:site-specific integrase [Legionella anisa]|uniref:Site-specific integrase n=1 Tax=Legionella anisa TaxID=28082 RepID=A0AAX0WVG4_9GAMM|nr:site-specific integrase [Legionella anisa]AWN73461.1 site-specific integrase [Legionella anisa]KTC66914.1 integrase [Legionella anisa]MCW8426333.1 tyrosine-type recombinase/integrase [Legionella anisa]MCW8447993.1 tyrosine-type recombinase/integrase [Legionella anisa]PNL62627.1 site-specific integrase [Legionella anisa]